MPGRSFAQIDRRVGERPAEIRSQIMNIASLTFSQIFDAGRLIPKSSSSPKSVQEREKDRQTDRGGGRERDEARARDRVKERQGGRERGRRNKGSKGHANTCNWHLTGIRVDSQADRQRD